MHMKHVAKANASAPFSLDSQSREVCDSEPHLKQILPEEAAAAAGALLADPCFSGPGAFAGHADKMWPGCRQLKQTFFFSRAKAFSALRLSLFSVSFTSS